MNIYKHLQSQIVILHQHVSVTAVCIIRVSYDRNTMNVLIIVQKCMIKPSGVGRFHPFIGHKCP